MLKKSSIDDKESKQLSDFAQKCVEDENARGSTSGAFARIRAKILEVPENVPITQPRLVKETGVANPSVNNVLRKMLEEKRLDVDRTAKPYRYYRRV